MTLPAPYYQAGDVTIYHGEALHILPHLEDVAAIVTDPPYSSGGAFRGDRMASTTAKYVDSATLAYRPEFAGDNRDQRGYFAWLALVMAGAACSARPGAVFAVFTDWRQLPTTTDAVQAGGWTWRGIAVWDKTGSTRPRTGGFSAQCEYVVWGSLGPLDGKANPVHPPGVVHADPVELEGAPGLVTIPTEKDKRHIAQKPEPVMEWLLSVCPPGGVIVDPFLGSGTTLVAAKLQGRRAVGIDTDERYCAMAASRLAQGALPFG